MEGSPHGLIPEAARKGSVGEPRLLPSTFGVAVKKRAGEDK
jgi:hypothetical protein